MHPMCSGDNNNSLNKFIVEKTQLLNPGGYVFMKDNQLVVQRGDAILIDRTYESLLNVPVLRARSLKEIFNISHVLNINTNKNKKNQKKVVQNKKNKKNNLHTKWRSRGGSRKFRFLWRNNSTSLNNGININNAKSYSSNKEVEKPRTWLQKFIQRTWLEKVAKNIKTNSIKHDIEVEKMRRAFKNFHISKSKTSIQAAIIKEQPAVVVEEKPAVTTPKQKKFKKFVVIQAQPVTPLKEEKTIKEHKEVFIKPKNKKAKRLTRKQKNEKNKSLNINKTKKIKTFKKPQINKIRRQPIIQKSGNFLLSKFQKLCSSITNTSKSIINPITSHGDMADDKNNILNKHISGGESFQSTSIFDNNSDDRLAGGDDSDSIYTCDNHQNEQSFNGDNDVYRAEPNILEHFAGDLNNVCLNCSALHFKDETNRNKMYKSCCHFGKLAYRQHDHHYPEYLKSLLVDITNSDHKNFMENIRSYNSALSFASMGASIEQFSQGVHFFKIHGQVYHNTYNINPIENVDRRYSQLYVIDTNEATDLRLKNSANERCDRNVLFNRDRTIREINPYAKAFKNLAEVERNAKREGKIPMNLRMVFNKNIHSDMNRYNAPTTDEVAMIFNDKNGEPPFERDIKVYARNAKYDNINLNILSPHLDPMTYTLLYPYGEPGWTRDLIIRNNNAQHKISMLQFKIAQLAIRKNVFNQHLYAGKLLQQWIVDSYLQVEANNLNYIRMNQKKLRIEKYKGLVDFLNTDDNLETPGKPVILPSTFQGSPRNMRERFYDAMAIVAKYGKPDLFITMTCNPNWREIKDNLYPGQTPIDRPDLIARVFKIKLNELKKDLTTNKVFGKVKAFVYTIEFQKRGLPHAHILIILDNANKIDTVEKIDNIVSAEIPSEQNKNLREKVLRHMIHGPCGCLNLNAPCMENGACIKEFPKRYNDTTLMNKNGYPEYRRRNSGYVYVKKLPVDNRNVVPYNKYLLMKYNCHINVEVCTSVKSVKYIFKYIYKGYDCANIHMYNNNEIDQYINTRYVSAPEAMWRLLEYKMSDRSHNIIRLPVHLPNEQNIVFEEGKEIEAIENNANKPTYLFAWFKLNEEDENARQYLYTDIPYHYVYANNKWMPRKKGDDKIITRMYAVNPKEKERFFLRILLLNVKGAKSFIDLKTVNNVVYNTFEEAARARNLLQNDDEWINVLNEAAMTQTSDYIRKLFSYICIFNRPNNIPELFNTFVSEMYDDIAGDVVDECMLRNMVLNRLSIIFSSFNLKVENFGLPSVDNHEEKICDEYNASEELSKAHEMIQMLNNEQKNVFDEVIRSISQNRGKLIFIDGPAGSGKTFIYQVIISYLRGMNKTVTATATTGIAADLIGGRTLHSVMKLPVPVHENTISSMKMDSQDAQKLRNTSLIIVDEVSMLSKYVLEAVDELLKRVMNNDDIFGGKVILLGGDFRQTPNVVMKGCRASIYETCIKCSKLWSDATTLKLSQNMRANNQGEFSKWLLDVGNGLADNNSMIEIPQQYITNNNIINEIYGDIILSNTKDLINRTILTTNNEIAKEINDGILNLMSTEAITYTSADSIVTEDNDVISNYPLEFLNKQQPSGMPPHKLVLKRGALVMLLRNIDPENGLLNGTRLIIDELHNNFIVGTIATGSKKGNRAIIPRIDMAPSETQLPFILKRRQFPVLLSFAMTIHKSQGQSFDKVGVYLRDPVFMHGQLYVALSRVRYATGLKIYIEPGVEQGKNKDNKYYTKNIVYSELLK